MRADQRETIPHREDRTWFDLLDEIVVLRELKKLLNDRRDLEEIPVRLVFEKFLDLISRCKVIIDVKVKKVYLEATEFFSFTVRNRRKPCQGIGRNLLKVHPTGVRDQLLVFEDRSSDRILENFERLKRTRAINVNIHLS